MFTNWLTGTSGTNNHNNSNNNNLNNPLNHNSTDLNRSTTNSSILLNSNTNLGGHILMSTPPDVILEVGPAPSTVRFVAHSIVLGMHSGYLRSAIRLDEHILAERTNAASTSASSTAAGVAATPDFILYLGNVTAEQFAPLLTYMYTGYLDLNIENIFGVLLATHVLHMPRALEICRAFLARAQTEGYLGARLSNNNLTNTNQTATTTNTNLNNINNNNKIIRPIPSKATIPNFGFLPTNLNLTTTTTTQQQQQPQQQQPQAHQQTTMPIMLANFKNLQRHNEFLYQQHQQHQQQQINSPTTNVNEIPNEKPSIERAKSEEIDVDQESIKAASENDIDGKNLKEISKLNNKNFDDDNDDEDEEVFIDSSDDIDEHTDNDDDDEMEVIIEIKQKQKQKQQHKLLKAKPPTKLTTNDLKIQTKIVDAQTKNYKKLEGKTANSNTNNHSHNHSHSNNTNQQQQQQQQQRRNSRRRLGKSRSNNTSGLQIAKAPIPASQLDANEGSKVIIDVASCDGPVRFRRILNTAYGHKPEDFTATTQMPTTERSQQSVSYSFHQQMARTIHHQQQQQQQQRHHHQIQQQNSIVEESENSESSGGGGGAGGIGGKHNKNSSLINSNEIYVCVYCKHTFKSQYCYQKHAKRHLNPLNLNPTERCEKIDNLQTTAAICSNTLNLYNGGSSSGNIGNGSTQFNSIGATGGVGAVGAANIPLPLLTTKQTANDLLRREVRPLDMNVQYYPCKTCGSKFPSYYFVHKHRKLCHADEELNVLQTTEKNNGNGGQKIENTQTNVDVNGGNVEGGDAIAGDSTGVFNGNQQPLTQDKNNSATTNNSNGDNDIQQQMKHEN